MEIHLVDSFEDGSVHPIYIRKITDTSVHLSGGERKVHWIPSTVPGYDKETSLDQYALYIRNPRYPKAAYHSMTDVIRAAKEDEGQKLRGKDLASLADRISVNLTDFLSALQEERQANLNQM